MGLQWYAAIGQTRWRHRRPAGACCGHAVGLGGPFPAPAAAGGRAAAGILHHCPSHAGASSGIHLSPYCQSKGSPTNLGGSKIYVTWYSTLLPMLSQAVWEWIPRKWTPSTGRPYTLLMVLLLLVVRPTPAGFVRVLDISLPAFPRRFHVPRLGGAVVYSQLPCAASPPLLNEDIHTLPCLL